MKKCTGCDNEKENSEFHKNSSKKDGLSSYCKECSKLYMKNYQEQNRERVNTYGREYYHNKKNLR